MLFILSAFWWIRIRGLWKLPDGRDWLKGKLGLILMGRAMLSKSLTQFSVDGQSCVSSLLFDLRPNYGGGNENNRDLLVKVPCMHCWTHHPNPAAGQHQPTPPPETPGHSWARLGQPLVGSVFLFPGSWCTQGFVCALQESVSQVLCKFWGLCGGVNGDLLHNAYAIPVFAAPRAPVHAAGHCWSIPLQETLKHSSGSPWLHWLCWSLWLCGSQPTVGNCEKDGNTRPPTYLRNLYASQEATVRIWHRTDGSKLGK